MKTSVFIHESLAQIELTQEFLNPENANSDNIRAKDDQKLSIAPVEVTYRFPKMKNSFISRLTVSIGDDRVIEGKVLEKEKAKEKYDDAIAAGHGAVMLKEDEENQELYEMCLGNIQPGQKALVKINIL